MLQTSHFNANLTDKALAGFFSHAGESFAEEALILGQTAQGLIDSGILLTNKNLIIVLIKKLKATENFVEADIIRKTLEIVVGHTSDDLGRFENL